MHGVRTSPWWMRVAMAVVCAGLLALPSQAAAQPTPLNEPLTAEVEEEAEGSEGDATDDGAADDNGGDAAEPDLSHEEPVLPFVPTEPATYPIAHTRRPLNLPRFNARAGGGCASTTSTTRPARSPTRTPPSR